MRFGLKTNQHGLDWTTLLERVRFAEDAGFDGAWIFDHLRSMDDDPRGPCMEAWTLLSALAASTSRIRLGALATGVTWRQPAVLATQAVSVDVVSNGRLELAIGASSDEVEHRAFGVPFPSARERIERLEEAAQVLSLVMTEDEATFEGRYYRLGGVTYRPRPQQRPHPPIWIGAGGERRSIPVAARRADVWHCFSPHDELPRKIAAFEEHAARAGRDPHAIVRATNLILDDDLDDVIGRAEDLRALGFTYLVVPWPSDRSLLDAFTSSIMPRLMSL